MKLTFVATDHDLTKTVVVAFDAATLTLRVDLETGLDEDALEELDEDDREEALALVREHTLEIDFAHVSFAGNFLATLVFALYRRAFTLYDSDGQELPLPNAVEKVAEAMRFLHAAKRRDDAPFVRDTEAPAKVAELVEWFPGPRG